MFRSNALRIAMSVVLAMGLMPMPAFADAEDGFGGSLAAGTVGDGCPALTTQGSDAYTRHAPVLASSVNGETCLFRVGGESTTFGNLGTYDSGDPEYPKLSYSPKGAYDTWLGKERDRLTAELGSRDAALSRYWDLYGDDINRKNEAYKWGPIKNVLFSGLTPDSVYVLPGEVGPWHFSYPDHAEPLLPFVKSIPYDYDSDAGEFQFNSILPDAYDMSEVQKRASLAVEMPVEVRQWFRDNMLNYDLVPTSEVIDGLNVIRMVNGHATAWSLFLYDAFCADYDAAKMGELYATATYDATTCKSAIEPLLPTLRSMNESERYALVDSGGYYEEQPLYRSCFRWNVIKGYGDFEVAAKDDPYNLSNASVWTEFDSYPYTGKAVTPAVAVEINSERLGGGDYSVSYSNNVNAGSAKATVKGKGPLYVGEKSVTFEIYKEGGAGKASLAEPTIKVSNVKKKLKAKKLKASAVQFKVSAKSNSGAAVTFKRVSGAKQLKIKGSKVVVKKGTRKGEYVMRVNACCKAKGNYAGGSKRFTVRVTVK